MREPAAGATTDRGSTFIELLVAIVLLGIVVVAVLAGLAASIRGTEIHRDESNAATRLLEAVEFVKDHPYIQCNVIPGPATQYGDAVALIAPAGWTYDVTDVDVDDDLFPGWPFEEGCFGNTGPLELVTVEVTHAETGTTRSVDIVKREPTP